MNAPLPESLLDLPKMIEVLYSLFARKRRGRRPWADIGFPDAKLDLPERVTVRELEVPDYLDLVWHSLCFDGERSETVQYFLPRVFEDFAKGNYNQVEPEMFVSDMNQCRWREWPPEKVAAVESFFYAWVAQSCTDRPVLRANSEVVDRLKVVAFSGAPLQPLFNHWLAAPGRRSAILLAELINAMWEGGDPDFPPGWNQVWGDEGVDRATVETIREFLMSSGPLALLEDAFFASDDAKTQAFLSNGIAILDSVRARRT